MVRYSAGIVTAYGAAKRAGYTGTYEDFCRQQAEYAENAAAVEQAKNTAVSAASTATTKAGEATTAATAAQTAKTQTEQAASQALTDIAAARSGAISAVQTEGQTQTVNARAQAQAAATSATTASTKASEASASATSAGQSATNAAASATSAATSASAAQAVLESIPEDYSDLSEDVDQLKADLGDKVDLPSNGYGASGKVLRSTGTGTEWATVGQPTDAQTAEAVSDWLDEHPEATTTIEDGSLELIKIKNVVNPDSFTGTDSEKLASAINSLENGGVILLGRNFTLTSNVVITRNSNRGIVIVKPLNATATINCGAYGFGGTGTSDGRTGGIHFVGIRFIGTGNLVDGYYLIRTFFTNCYFENFNNLIYSSTAHVTNKRSTRYLQSIYFNRCVIRNMTDYIIDASTVNSVYTSMYDIRINNTIIEWSHGIIKGGNWQGVFINENCIEGFDTIEPLFCNFFSCKTGTISNNYFEKNVATTIDLTGYIIGNVFSLEISNNVFIESTKDSGAVILLPTINPSHGFLNIKNNRIIVKSDGSAYGISVDSNTSDLLSHVNLEGNYCTINDVNNKIPNTKTLSELQVDTLYKIDYILAQTPGTYKFIEIPITAIVVNSNLIRVPVSFPFTAKNTNYSVDINGCNITSIGQVKDSTSVYQKKNGGVVLGVSGTWTSGKVYDGVVALKITFA